MEEREYTVWFYIRRISGSMTASLLFKIIIIFLLLLILASLASGMLFLVKDKGESDRMAKSLTVRITLSILLFILLFVGYFTGLIKPHGVVPPAQTEKALPEQRLPETKGLNLSQN